MQNLLDDYNPTWWTNTHIQLFLTFVVPKPNIEYKREVLQLKDGGHLALDWAIDHHNRLVETSPIVLVIHGLTGCSKDMISICALALSKGFRPVVFNRRGHGGMTLATPKFQEFMCTSDFEEAIDQIEQHFPDAEKYGIGYSAGSATLSSYLGKKGKQSKLFGGVFVSPGYDTVDLICKGNIHRFYDFLMSIALRRMVLQHRDQLKKVIDVKSALRATSLHEFEEHVSSKIHGYADSETYWKNNNPVEILPHIKYPILAINALDDPVCTAQGIPYDIIKNTSDILLVETGEGSHCAFFEGHLRLESWSNKAAIHFLESVYEFRHRKTIGQLITHNMSRAAAAAS
jgi:abhydrolase domain-containing protein 15